MAGKHNWGDINCTVKDDVNNSVSTLIAHQLQKQLNFYDQQATAAGANYKFKMSIDILDGTSSGIAVESWLLEGCFLKNVNYQELDYGESNFMTIQMSIRCDNATCVTSMTAPTGSNTKTSIPLNTSGNGNTLD
jgi:hypothetical protein